MTRFAGFVVALLIFTPPMQPSKAAEELLATDRAFSTSAASLNLVDALTAMFREDVVMPAPPNFASTRAEARAALSANAANLTSRAEWTPLRAGVSADGAHGFTFGLMTIRLADGTTRPAKYMAYWIKEAGAWRVAVYKRAPAAAGTAQAPMPPSLPPSLVPVSTDRSRIEALRKSLIENEKAFSDEAQVIGIGPAFAKYGSPDAVNMGSPKQSGFTVGATAIAADVGAAVTGSGLSWSADRAIVASSGDLGVTIGYIRSNDAAANRPPSPFFTIWRRNATTDPWRYVAE